MNKAGLFEQAIEHATGGGTMCATALESQVESLIACDRCWKSRRDLFTKAMGACWGINREIPALSLLPRNRCSYIGFANPQGVAILKYGLLFGWPTKLGIAGQTRLLPWLPLSTAGQLHFTRVTGSFVR